VTVRDTNAALDSGGPPIRPVPAADLEAPARGRSAAGVLYVVLSALGFASMAVFARHAYASGVDTATLLLLRFATAGAILWIVFAARRTRLPRGRGLLMLVGMGAVGYAGQAYSFFTALTLASAGLAALLLYLYPALVAVLSRVVFRQPLSRLQLGAIAMALAGSALTIGWAVDGSALGVLFGVLAAVIYACYILTGSRLPRDVTPTASAAVVTTSAAVVYGVAAMIRGVRWPATAGGWLAVAAIAVVSTAMAIAFFLEGLERLGPVRASVYSTLEPVFTLVLASSLLGERAAPLSLAGGALILGAVLILARSDARRLPLPAPDRALGDRRALAPGRGYAGRPPK
jgi:drug/metabolite transporter (DMT)-like permease